MKDLRDPHSHLPSRQDQIDGFQTSDLSGPSPQKGTVAFHRGKIALSRGLKTIDLVLT